MGFLAAAVAAIFAMPAMAVQWLSQGAVQIDANTWSMTVGGQTVLAHAYSTRTASGTSSIASSGLFANTPTMAMFSGAGFGIGNNIVGDTSEGTPPEHAVDNNQIFDVIVFELPAAGFDLEAFRLGWAQEGTISGQADLSVFFGGNALGANYDFTQTCFSGCASVLTSAAKGFTDITSILRRADNNALLTTGDTNVPANIDILANGTQSGRYLVMTGALGGSNDNFKVEMLRASGGTGTAPVPGTLALLGLGLVGLASVRRRRPTAV